MDETTYYILHGYTGEEEASIDKRVACEECPRWLVRDHSS